MRRRLILYARRPLAGQAKTRLGALIGCEEAAGAYARVLFSILAQAERCRVDGVECELAAAESADVPFFAGALPGWAVRPQSPGDLGARMAASFAQAFADGIGQAVLVGSDIPSLDVSGLRAAFAALDRAAVVIGPAEDGGYYLLGMRSPGLDLFSGVAWSSASVFAETQAKARGAAVQLLQVLSDLDEKADWQRWRDAVAEGAAARPADPERSTNG